MERSGVLVALCLVLTMVPACKKASESSAEKAAERAIERATGNQAKVDISGDGVKIVGKEGGKEFTYEVSGGGGAAVPQSFPDDIPRYPGAAVLSSMIQGNAMTMVTFQTGDETDRVYEFYGSKLRESGWNIENELSTPQMRLISGKKAGRQANVTVVSDEGKSTITVVYSGGKG